MAFLGNIDGPRESHIIQSLGRNYFGITPTAFEADIEMYEDSERRGEVQPVHIDKNDGRPYIVLSRPNNENSRFYLSESKWNLKGDINTFTDEEKIIWKQKNKERI